MPPDAETMTWVIEQNNARDATFFASVEKIRETLDGKLTAMQNIHADQNARLAAGNEKFKAMELAVKVKARSDNWWKGTLLTLILALGSGIGWTIKTLLEMQQ